MFHGIQPRRYRDVLDCLHASVHQYPRNTHLVELGEQSHNTGILLDGTVEEFLYDENGNQVSICRLASGQIFGAELACTGWSTSPVCLRADSDCTVLRLDFSALMSQQTMTCPCRMQVTANLMQDAHSCPEASAGSAENLFADADTGQQRVLSSAVQPHRTCRLPLCRPQRAFPRIVPDAG